MSERKQCWLHGEYTGTCSGCKKRDQDLNKGEHMKTINLSEEQTKGVKKLIDNEIETNVANGDDAYNTFWESINELL